MRLDGRLWVLVWVFGVSFVLSGGVRAGVAAATEPGPRLQFRLVAPAGNTGAADELEDPEAPGVKVRVLREVLMNESALASVRLQPPGKNEANQGNHGVVLEFTPAGTRTFGEITSGHLNERLAVVVDGKLLWAPVIRAPIVGGSAVVTFGGKTTAAEIQAIAATLKSLVGRPATAPAAK